MSRNEERRISWVELFSNVIDFFRAPEHMREGILVNLEFGEMPKQMMRMMTRRSTGITRVPEQMRRERTLLDCGWSTGIGVCGERLMWDRRH